MRAAKGRSSSFFFAAIALSVSSSALASIPRTTTLDAPAIDRYATHDDILSLHDWLVRAARASWPIESLPETRVGASALGSPLFAEPTPLLTRALHQAWADLDTTNASGRTLRAGDPVNGRDPKGEATASDASRVTQAKARKWAMTFMLPRNPLLAVISLPARYAIGEAAAGLASTLEFGEHFAKAWDAAKHGDIVGTVNETVTDVVNGVTLFTGLKGLTGMGGVKPRLGTAPAAAPVTAVTPEGVSVPIQVTAAESEAAVVLRDTESVAPGQRASAYPKGRRVGGLRESRRPTDPLPGFREEGAFEWTPENIRLMEEGRPPLTPEGEPVELHHQNQNPAGPLDELRPTTHDGVDHPVRPSQIDRAKFRGERRRYWIQPSSRVSRAGVKWTSRRSKR